MENDRAEGVLKTDARRMRKIDREKSYATIETRENLNPNPQPNPTTVLVRHCDEPSCR